MTARPAAELESPEALSPGARAALRNLLTACADTKLLLGYHYGEWTFGTPELEAAVANCSLAQSELGHVRLLHGVLKAHFGEDPDHLVETRPAAAFASIAYLDRPIRDWPGVVAMNFVVDLAVTRVLFALRATAFVPLRAGVEKMLEEERHHLHHGRGWFRRLAAGDPATRQALAASARAAVAATVEWLGPEGAPEDRTLVEAGLKADSDVEVRRALLEDLARVAGPLELDLTTPRVASFEGWTAGTRRVEPGGPSEEVLYHLRGTKNAVFKRS